MITKVTNSTKKVNPFGGIFFVINDLKNKGLSKLIDSQLGKRVKQARYSYSDIILNWAYCNLCGAERLEDIEKLRDSLDMKLPSHDSLGHVFKSFSRKLIHINDHEFSIHKPLNKLMVRTALNLGLLNTQKSYTLDYDNTIIEHQKYDKKMTYKMIKGYQPGVSFIDKIPVYIEGRNGNSNAAFQITETVERSLELLEESGIKIKRFRSDSAAYARPMLKMLDKKGIDFFIRPRKSHKIMDSLADATGWSTIELYRKTYQAKSIDYTPIGGSKYRMVIYRTEAKDEWKYLSVITNNWTMSEYEIIRFYNQRGEIERNFDDLKNNFNWGHLPFSFLNENTVFMIISAIVSIIYQYLIREFSKKVDFVKRTHRLKNFIYHFIVCSAIMEGEQLQLFTNRDYSGLIEIPDKII